MASGTVNIQFTERLDKDVARVYGIISASLGGAHVGTATFDASRFGLKTIRTVQLSGQTTMGGAEPHSLAASMDPSLFGSPGNSFLLMGSPWGKSKGPNVQFEIIGE